MKILLIGLGNFGLNHFRAWHEIGCGGDLFIVEVDSAKHKAVASYRFPSDRVGTDIKIFWDSVDIVDIVTGTDTHFELCRKALLSGKSVFVEKPMTMTADQARNVGELVEKSGGLLQVGYYYRYHPISQYIQRQIQSGALGQLRYLDGNFMGFKRARTDVGVMHTDGIHFIDLFNWFVGSYPVDVYAVTRDHFRRGLEDLAIGVFGYQDGLLAKVEAGYVQPGQWHDKVVPGAMTTKAVTVIGSQKTIVADYEAETVQVHDVHHELKNGVWSAVNQGCQSPAVDTATPIQMLSAELRDFSECVQSGRRPAADVRQCGIALAVILEALYESAKTGRRIQIVV